MMFDDVGRCFTNLISVKHPETFLLFPSLMNNVWFVWTACKTLLASRTRARLRLILIWANSVPESLSFTMFYKTCFTLLDSRFGHPVEHRPTLFCKTMLDDVLWCFTRLDGALVVDFLVGFSLDRFRRVWVSTWRPSAPLFLVSTSCPMMSCWRFCHKPRIQQQCSLTWGNALRTLQRYVFWWCTFERKIVKIKGSLGFVERGKKGLKHFVRKAAWLKFTAVNADRPTAKTLTSCYAVICESNQRTLRADSQMCWTRWKRACIACW